MKSIGWAARFIFVGAAIALTSVNSVADDKPQVKEDGTIHVPAFSLPPSSFLSKDTQAEVNATRERYKKAASAAKTCPPIAGAERTQMPAIRKCHAEAYYSSDAYKRLRERYSVAMDSQDIGGVATEVFTPADGIAQKNLKRVLINVHGGAFMGGARTSSHMESIPIASVGKIKVVSVDYRMAPEYSFPAASEDVAAVYRALLKTYPAKSIGIYGCSAGGVLTTQAVAWLQRENLPVPGAVGIFCAAGSYWTEGDSGYFAAALDGKTSISTVNDNPYFKGANPDDPLVFPTRSAQVLGKFPPSLLIASTRDLGLSSVAYMHSRLVALGVEADLHVWEGLGHGFFMDPALAESREVYDVTVKFFDKHLKK